MRSQPSVFLYAAIPMLTDGNVLRSRAMVAAASAMTSLAALGDIS